MKKIIAVLVLLVFVFGCGDLSFGGDKEKTSERYGFGSSSGLSISFVEDEPQKEVSRDRNIKFTLNVRNTGTASVPSGAFMARLVGLDNNFNPSDLEGANSDLINEVDESGIGGEALVELGSTSYNPEQMFDDRIIKSGTLEAEVCYPYETKVVIDNFYIGSKTSDVEGGALSSNSNSNAPVQVKELEEKGGGTYTDFTFKIKVVGKGTVVSSCFPSKDEEEKNVDLRIFERDVSCYFEDGGERREIGSEGAVKLNNLNEKIIHCRIPFSGEKPIKTQLQMTLTYLYLDKISVPEIKITRI
ncbi:MAG: hypothetical protein ABIH63_03180 [archaeon]